MKRKCISCAALLMLLAAPYKMYAQDKGWDFKIGDYFYKILTPTTVSIACYPYYEYDGAGINPGVPPIESKRRKASFSYIGISETVARYEDEIYTVTEIADSAFYKRPNLIITSIPATIEKIGKAAYAKCDDLMQINNFAAIPQSISNDTFSSEISSETTTLHVPIGCKEAYMKAPVWNKFYIVDDIVTGIEDIQDVKNEYRIFTLSGAESKTTQKGINIIKTKNNKKAIKVLR